MDSHKKLKLALVRQRYNPFGGAERFIERALGALLKEGAEVTLIARAWQSDVPQPSGFLKQICDPPYARIWGGRTARDKSFSEAVEAIMQSGAYDIVQSHERIPGCTIFRAGDGVHAAWLDHRARKVSVAKNLFARLSSYHRHILQAEETMLAHPSLRSVICNSQLVYDEMQRYYQVPEEKLTLIENGVDLEDFHPRLQAHAERERTALDMPHNVPLFLFVGSGFERKGVATLLSSFARMKNKAARLVIVGDDRHFSLYVRQAKKLGILDRVLFAGPQKDVRPFYAAADVFVLPTLYDPMPNAALEAMATGLPIVTSTGCGIASRVKNGENGFVCDALDIAMLARHLDDLSEKSVAKNMREAARAAVLDLSLAHMTARLLALYESIKE